MSGENERRERITVTKPGTALRATGAFVLLNLPLLVTIYFVYWMTGGEAAELWVRIILAVLVAAAEFAIVVTTIGPPLYDWIKTEETIYVGDKPSWEQ